MCTSITIKSNQNHYYWGRTQEYNIDLNYCAMVIPRGYQLKSFLTPLDVTYAVFGMGVSLHGVNLVIDGMNEKGLTGGSLYFANYAKFCQEEEIKNLGKSPVRGEEILTWILAKYKSVSDVKENLNRDIAVADTPNILGDILPQHVIMSDRTGASIVIEPSEKNHFEIYDNPVHVATNSPRFDWHLINLQNYIHLTDQIRPEITIDQEKVFTPGKGTGLIGLPGDYTPQSRFVRAVTLKRFATPVNDNKAINLLFHILNTSDIPHGVVKVKGNEDVEYTMYTSAYDLEKLTLYVHTYDVRVIQKFQPKEADFSGNEIKIQKLSNEEVYIEL